MAGSVGSPPNSAARQSEGHVRYREFDRGSGVTGVGA